MEGATDVKSKGHCLDVLYSSISSDTIKKIEKEYREIGGEERKNTLYLRACLEGVTPVNENNQSARGTKLHQILKNNKDIFVVYRYMFEKGRAIDWEYFYFEFGNLDLVIFSLEKIANEMLSSEQVQRLNSM